MGILAATLSLALATGVGAFDGDEPRVEATLVVHPDAENGTRRRGVLFQMDPGWHIYWSDPGQSGLPTELEWELDAASIGPIAWPPHQTFEEHLGDEVLTTYGYEDRVLLAVEARGVTGETAEVTAHFLACQTECIPGKISLGGRLDELVSAAVFPEAAPKAGVGLARALLLAFVGGLILNLMPCVLPVLMIKVVTITEIASRSRAEVLSHGAAYTIGILGTMLILGATVCLMRAAGQSVGWGFQFQEPLFIAAISTVLVVFALNLFGVFEITLNAGGLAQLGQQAAGARRSFFEGLLAVVLATPCSAPFLGTAVGFAFASPTGVILSIFAAIGLGLAFPFVAISMLPGLARVLPRPGAWMLRLRASLGFALVGTNVWLLWILGRSAGVDAMVTLLAFLVAVAFTTWLFGMAQLGGHQRIKAAVGMAVLVLGLAGLSAVGLRHESQEVRAFDPASITQELEAGRTVFVYFTADWCITCAANERLVLSDDRVQAAFGRGDVAVFKADWTRRDESIRLELARFGRAGVPMYLVYRAGAEEDPIVLPELLNVDLVLEALSQSS